MSKEVATKKITVWNEKTHTYDRHDREVPPIRRIIDKIYKEKKGWFGNRTFEYDDVSKTEKFQYFWNGEWIDIPTEYNSTEIK